MLASGSGVLCGCVRVCVVCVVCVCVCMTMYIFQPIFDVLFSPNFFKA